MRTVSFMSTNFPVSFSVEDKVAERLLEQASANKNGNASSYVNRLLAWAVDNYKEQKPVEVQNAEK